MERDGGTGLGLDVAPFSTKATIGTLSARWYSVLHNSRVWLTPELDCALSYGGGIAPTSTAHLEGAPKGTGNFTIIGAGSRPLFGVVGVGVAIGSEDGAVSMHLKYERRFEGIASQYDGLLSASYHW